jgi:hypothetical protein
MVISSRKKLKVYKSQIMIIDMEEKKLLEELLTGSKYKPEDIDAIASGYVRLTKEGRIIESKLCTVYFTGKGERDLKNTGFSKSLKGRFFSGGDGICDLKDYLKENKYIEYLQRSLGIHKECQEREDKILADIELVFVNGEQKGYMLILYKDVSEWRRI